MNNILLLEQMMQGQNSDVSVGQDEALPGQLSLKSYVKAQKLAPGCNRSPGEEGVIPGKILATANMIVVRKRAVKGEASLTTTMRRASYKVFPERDSKLCWSWNPG